MKNNMKNNMKNKFIGWCVGILFISSYATAAVTIEEKFFLSRSEVINKYLTVPASYYKSLLNNSSIKHPFLLSFEVSLAPENGLQYFSVYKHDAKQQYVDITSYIINQNKTLKKTNPSIEIKKIFNQDKLFVSNPRQKSAYKFIVNIPLTNKVVTIIKHNTGDKIAYVNLSLGNTENSANKSSANKSSANKSSITQESAIHFIIQPNKLDFNHKIVQQKDTIPQLNVMVNSNTNFLLTANKNKPRLVSQPVFNDNIDFIANKNLNTAILKVAPQFKNSFHPLFLNQEQVYLKLTIASQHKETQKTAKKNIKTSTRYKKNIKKSKPTKPKTVKRKNTPKITHKNYSKKRLVSYLKKHYSTTSLNGIGSALRIKLDTGNTIGGIVAHVNRKLDTKKHKKLSITDVIKHNINIKNNSFIIPIRHKKLEKCKCHTKVPFLLKYKNYYYSPHKANANTVVYIPLIKR